MQNVKQIWQETAKQLEKVYDQREAESIAYILLEDLFEIDKATILAERDSSYDQDKLRQAVLRLLDFEPVQYVTGIADFYGRKFEINKGALIPRPETEELIELILKENNLEKPRIMDVGSGSGCIAITLAIETLGNVFGVDISEEAIKVAQRNASKFSVSVSFLRKNVLDENLPEKELDILVSNPPYIPEGDKRLMHENVLMHEPEIALFVPSNEPILFYKRIADLGKLSLKSGGRLYFEIHERYGQEVQEYLEIVGYSHVKMYQDMQGKDRMISAIN